MSKPLGCVGCLTIVCIVGLGWCVVTAGRVSRSMEDAKQKAAVVAKENATKAVDEAVRTFPERKAALKKQIAVLEGQTKRREWQEASVTLTSLNTALIPLLHSTLSNSPEVQELSKRLNQQKVLVEAFDARLGKEPGYCPGSGLKKSRLGSHPPPCAVEFYLSKALNDPDSFESGGCDVGIAGDSYVADCTFRARNAFGALTRQRWRFWIRDDVVTKADQL